jgi:hypothetical protein
VPKGFHSRVRQFKSRTLTRRQRKSERPVLLCNEGPRFAPLACVRLAWMGTDGLTRLSAPRRQDSCKYSGIREGWTAAVPPDPLRFTAMRLSQLWLQEETEHQVLAISGEARLVRKLDGHWSFAMGRTRIQRKRSSGLRGSCDRPHQQLTSRTGFWFERPRRWRTDLRTTRSGMRHPAAPPQPHIRMFGWMSCAGSGAKHSRVSTPGAIGDTSTTHPQRKPDRDPTAPSLHRRAAWDTYEEVKACPWHCPMDSRADANRGGCAD